MRERSKGVRFLVACAGAAWALAGCSDPYKQTVAVPGGDKYPSFTRAMEKLPGEEKRLVNEYVARQEHEGVRPVGVTYARRSTKRPSTNASRQSWSRS
jgi:hypothetical protein